MDQIKNPRAPWFNLSKDELKEFMFLVQSNDEFLGMLKLLEANGCLYLTRGKVKK